MNLSSTSNIIAILIVLVLAGIFYFYKQTKKEQQVDEQNTMFQESPRPEDTIISNLVKDRLLKGKGVSKEIAIIKAMLAHDPAYAWSWHSNIVMSFVDAECDKIIAMEGSARFLQLFADIDIYLDERFIEEMDRLKQQKMKEIFRTIPDGTYDGYFRNGKYLIDHNDDFVTVIPENKITIVEGDHCNIIFKDNVCEVRNSTKDQT